MTTKKDKSNSSKKEKKIDLCWIRP